MKMIHQLTLALVGILLLQSAIVDAKVDEFLEMKVFNHEFRPSDSEMHAILHKANLMGHGYKKEVVTKVVQKDDGGQEYQNAHYYYKDVDCSKIQEVEQHLRRLLPSGVIGKDMEHKLKTEIKTRNLGSMGMCRVGLEVHFKEAEGCNDNQKAVSKRRKKRGCGSWWCFICLDIKISQSGNNNNVTRREVNSPI